MIKEPGWVHVSVMAHAGYLPGGSGKGTGGVHSFYWRRKFHVHTRGGAGGCWLELAGFFCALYVFVCSKKEMRQSNNPCPWKLFGLELDLIYQQRTAQVDNCR